MLSLQGLFQNSQLDVTSQVADCIWYRDHKLCEWQIWRLKNKHTTLYSVTLFVKYLSFFSFALLFTTITNKQTK